MRNIYSPNKPNALEKLLDAIDKGIDLLTNKNLDKELYEAYERYVISTVKLVDAYNQTNYRTDFMQSNNDFMFNRFNIPSNLGVYNNPINPYNNSFNLNMSNYNLCSWENIGVPRYNMGIPQEPEINYQDKLKEVLKKLVSVAKVVAYE